jgi:hypothetical protein
MSLWLNKTERVYLLKVVQEDLDAGDSSYDETMSVDQRKKLLKKIEDVKV